MGWDSPHYAEMGAIVIWGSVAAIVITAIYAILYAIMNERH